MSDTKNLNEKQLKELNNRIQNLEDKMNNLMSKMDVIITIISNINMNNSNNKNNNNNKEVIIESVKKGEKIALFDHIATEEEIKKIGLGISTDKLIEGLIKHEKNGTMEQFVGDLIIDYYKKHCRLNDLTLLD
jgi:TolA-binding protein